MGKGSNAQTEDYREEKRVCKNFSWKEIKERKNCLVIENKVYDISNFKKRHPGGSVILMNHVTEDATDAFYAFHSDLIKVSKYLKTIEIGRLEDNNYKRQQQQQDKNDEVIEDFRKLKTMAQKMGLFKTDYAFFMAHFAHIVLLDLLAWFLIYYSGYSNWLTYLLAVGLLVISQAQAGWSQHDYGHLSVFKSNKLNHFMHRVIIGFIKGAGADWWNFRHFNHHAKPNVHKKDPDIAFGHWFTLGKILPREIGTKKLGKYPYNSQQHYFYLIIPPLLLPLIFHIHNVVHLMRKKSLSETLWFFSFYVRFFLQYGNILGLGGTLGFYMLIRFFESYWFTFVTQMNHLPMHIDHDRQINWFEMQLLATCNVQQSNFNDWFSGHLNFQIEHHLFPTMPRHNYSIIAPYVKSLCEKHNIDYQNKTLYRAMADIYVSLKQSGELWYEAYNM